MVYRALYMDCAICAKQDVQLLAIFQPQCELFSYMGVQLKVVLSPPDDPSVCVEQPGGRIDELLKDIYFVKDTTKHRVALNQFTVIREAFNKSPIQGGLYAKVL